MAKTECPHCQKPLTVKGRFCYECGRAMESSSDTEGVFTWALEDLFQIARTLSATLDLDLLLKKIGQAAEKLTDSEASSILLLTDDRKSLYFKTATGVKGQVVRKFTVPVGTGVAGWVAEKGEPVIVNDVSKDARFANTMDKNTGFVTKSILAVPLLVGGDLIGVCEAINKRGKGGFVPSDKNILQNLANFAAVSIMNARLAENQKNFFTNMLEILTMAMESAEPKAVGHPSRVAELACSIGRQMGIQGQAYKDLYYAALLHDIGMIALNHPNLREQALIMGRNQTPEYLHPVLGAELIKHVKILEGVVPTVRHHHELWDGSGHPDHLTGEQIPLASRIICLVEYMEEIRFSGLQGSELSAMQTRLAKEESGVKFDPQVVDAYLSLVSAGRGAEAV